MVGLSGRWGKSPPEMAKHNHTAENTTTNHITYHFISISRIKTLITNVDVFVHL